MAPLNDEQLHQIRDERKEQIITAALKVFAQKGIIGTKMSMIAAEAGISHGLLYHYFKSKDELFNTLVEGAMQASQAAMSSIYELPGSPLDKLRALSEEILDESGTPYFMLIHQARTADGVPEKARELVEHYSVEAFVDKLLPLFKEGQQSGEFAKGRLEDLITTYLSVLSGIMILNNFKESGYKKPEIDILLRMVTCR